MINKDHWDLGIASTDTKPERNAEIIRAAMNGTKRKDIAAKHGLRSERVRQICTKAKRTREWRKKLRLTEQSD